MAQKLAWRRGPQMSRRIWLLLILFFCLRAEGEARDIRVPSDYSTIQMAVEAAEPGTTILIEPGTYAEHVEIHDRYKLHLLGIHAASVEPVDRFFACWEIAAQQARDVIVVGTIDIHSSREILIEGLTVTGPGPGILIRGSESLPSADVGIRSCNLVCNEMGAVVLTGEYRHVALTCTNACHREQGLIVAERPERLRQQDVFTACVMSLSEDGQPVHMDGSVVVAVIDSGIDQSIGAISCRLWTNPGEIADNGIDDDHNGYVDDIHGWDFRDNDSSSMVGSRIHWHGTFVAGILADAFEMQLLESREDVAPLQIMDLRFLDSAGRFFSSAWSRLVQAVDYAVDHGARIINLSIYAILEPPPAVREALQRAMDRGVSIISIAGNSGGAIGPIADWQEIMTVGASTGEAARAPFSSVGTSLDFVSYGTDVLSFLPGGNLTISSGTSFAAPRIAGIAAYHIAQDPALTPSDLEAILREAATDILAPGFDVETGWGMIR